MKGKIIFSILAVVSLSACKPTASNQQVLLQENTNTPITLKATDRDGDELTWYVEDPAHGLLRGTPPNLTYVPNANYVGPDAFSFRVNDGKDDSNTATVTLAVNQSFPSWVTDQANSIHNAYVPVTLNTDIFTETFNVLISEGGLYTQLATGAGNAYVTSYSEVMALRLSDGEKTWNHEYLRYDIHTNAPAYNNGKVFFQGSKRNSTPSMLMGYDAVTGEKLINTPFSSQWESHLAPTIFNDNIYVNVGTYGGLASYSEQGQQNWFKDQAQEDLWTPAVTLDKVISFTGNELDVFNRVTGELLLHIDDPNSTYNHIGLGNAPIYDEERNLVYARQRNRITAFNITDGTALWSVTDNYAGQMAFDGKYLYVNNGSALNAVDVMTGNLIWSWQADSELRFNIIVTDNLVFTASEATSYAIAKDSQEVLWTAAIGGRLALSGDGGLFISSESGYLALYDVEGDSDNDGIPNWYERAFASNPWIPDEQRDLDKDSLSALQEYQYGTDPTKKDTDGDSLSDGDEINRFGTNPHKLDTDGDKLQDNIELDHSLNPLNKGDAYLDADDDGFYNLTEILAKGALNDASIQPHLFSGGINFESGNFDPALSIAGDQSTWSVSSSDLPSSQYSLQSNGTTTLILEDVFAYGHLTFSYKSDCNKSYLFLDGTRVALLNNPGWIEYSLQISQGAHKLEWFTADCDGKPLTLDNINFTTEEVVDVASYPVLGVDGGQLNLADYDGRVIESVSLPMGSPGCCVHIRDVVVLADGRLAFVNGTFSGTLTLFDPHKGFLHIPLYNWHIVNNISYGGIDASGDYVFMSATAISGEPFTGFVRINTKTHEVKYVTTETSYDITVGQDGFIYTISDGVHKYDLETLEYMGEVLGDSDRAVAVDADSNVYIATWGGKVKKYSSTYELIGEATVTGSLFDINIHNSGYLMVSDRNKNVSILTSELEVLGSWENIGNFSAWGEDVNVDLLRFSDSEITERYTPLMLRTELLETIAEEDGADELGFVNAIQPPDH